MIWLHKLSNRSPILHSHFPNRAWFIVFNDLEASPPSLLGLQTELQSIRWNFFLVPLPCHRKFCWSFSIRLTTDARTFEDKHEVDWKVGAEWIKVIFPLKDKYFGFHKASFCSTHSATVFQTCFEALPRQRGNLRYEVGSDPTLHPIMVASTSRNCTSTSIPIRSLLEKFTLRSETASKHLRIATTFLIYCSSVVQKIRISFANVIWVTIGPLIAGLNPLIRLASPATEIIQLRALPTMAKRNGERGSPRQGPFWAEK